MYEIFKKIKVGEAKMHLIIVYHSYFYILVNEG